MRQNDRNTLIYLNQMRDQEVLTEYFIKAFDVEKARDIREEFLSCRTVSEYLDFVEGLGFLEKECPNTAKDIHQIREKLVDLLKDTQTAKARGDHYYQLWRRYQSANLAAPSLKMDIDPKAGLTYTSPINAQSLYNIARDFLRRGALIGHLSCLKAEEDLSKRLISEWEKSKSEEGILLPQLKAVRCGA